MWMCVKWEGRRQLRLPRFWGSLAALFVLGLLFTYGYAQLRGQPALAALLGNGLTDGFFVPILAISVSASMMLPFFISLITGDAISGERQWGTWATLLTQGVPPWRLYTSKWIVGLAYAALATLVLAGTSLAGGVAMFGWHATVLPSGLLASTGTLALLLAVACLYAMAGQMVVASLALAVSAYCRHTVSAIMVTMGVLIFMVLLGNLPFLRSVNPFLFTTYFSRIADVLSSPPNWALMGQGLLVYGTYTALSWAIVFWAPPFRG